MMKKALFLLTIFSIVQGSHLLAYHGSVHQKINENAVIEASQLDLILKSQLGLDEGIETKLIKQGDIETILQWISYGGEAEDYGYVFKKDPVTSRAYNHFHDPLKDWKNAGLYNGLLEKMYFINYLKYPVSAILWGLNPGEQDFIMNLTGDWSWGKAKESFYIYLTGKNFENELVADAEDERNTYFAHCFRSLGQVMHLLQDLSVPLHTRNDVHIFPLFDIQKNYWTYETYTKNNIDILDFIPDQSGEIPDPHFFEVPVIIQDPDFPNLPPVVGLFDRNAYNGSGSIPQSNILGLAEYSNANFLTTDTMWTYPHPSKADTNIGQIDWLYPEIVIADDGKKDARIYIRKTVGEEINHLAVADYWTYEYFGHISTIPKGLALDDECWKEYASFLIPRAVGYSAALLDYFFRGKLDVTCLPVFYNNNLFALSLKIKNMTSSQETMSEGTFSLVFKYNDGSNDQYVLAYDVPSGSLTYDNEVEINFFLPWGSADEIITKEEYESGVTCTLVFKGTLGNESGAVVGKVFTLGEEIKFNEEWDNGLTGNYAWTHSTADQNPSNGTTVNVVENGILIKENMRYAGFSTPRNNESFLYLPEPGIPINSHTSLQFKIDELSINNRPPDGYHWQVMMLYFNDGDLNLQFSIDGQWADLGWPNTGYYSFTPEAIILGNIHAMFNNASIQIPDPLYLNMIGLGQQLDELPTPSVTQNIQHMEVDFIRIIDEKPTP
jgi:hypothetical protein